MWRENCVNTRRYCKTVAEVRGIWCTRNDTCALFPVSAKSDKMTVQKSFNLWRTVFSDTVVCSSLKLLLEKF